MFSNSTIIFDTTIANCRIKESTAPVVDTTTKKKLLFLIHFLGIGLFMFSQNTMVVGAIIEQESAMKIVDARIIIEGTAFVETTNVDGQFTFDEPIPQNEYVVSVSKDGYEERFFLINVIEGKKLKVDQIELKVTKKERKRRKKLKKSWQKESVKQDKKVTKEKKKLKKDNKGPLSILKKKKDPVGIAYEDIEEEPEEEEFEEAAITFLQKKYATILGVTPEDITNTELYAFIEDWMGTPYRMGGESKEGIDCSSFAQRLFLAVYNELIERTAQNQMDSKSTKTFAGVQFLEEGDLVFFRAAGDLGDTITHVGIYLGEKKFVNATSRKGKSSRSGVKISDLSDSYWNKRFFAGGRRVITKS